MLMLLYMNIQRCQQCKITKECVINTKSTLKDGTVVLRFLCRDCLSERARKYRKTERGKIIYRNMMRRQYHKHREKVLARIKLNRNVKSGATKKPKKCQICKKIKLLDGHHTDYTKPLDVQWLCRSCHFNV